MKLYNHPPNLFIYTPDQRIYKGMVVDPLDFTVDYNFNAVSQMKFRVNKYIYDTDNYTWIKNPCYDYLNEHMVVKSSDTSNKFKFKGSAPKEYTIPVLQPNSRNSNNASLGFSVTLNNATLQDEVELFDIGSKAGYKWQYYSYINEHGAFVDASDNNFYFNRIACKEFFPVQVGDIIAMGSKVDNNMHFNANGNEYYSYRLHFYFSESSSSHSYKTEFALYNPVGRIRVTEDMLKSYSSGYVRIEAISHQATLSSDNTAWHCTSPREWFVKIYSGERRCLSIETNAEIYKTSPQDLWVVKDIDITKDCINEYKTVVLYSYEYTLSYKSLSLGESTLSLYIPDNIVNLVNSQYFFIDSVDGTNYNGAQRMFRGLLNQVLDYLPDWSIGYINPDVVTRYRTIPEVDNGNIYSFLINTVQPLYQCYFMFDSTKKTINILAQTDVTYIQSSTHLTWSNALKSMNVSNTDTSFVTALRVHTAEDRYNIGLVNPLGNNIIYDFSHIIDDLDFVADPNHYKEGSQNPYTLREVLEEHKVYLKQSLGSYREAAQNLVKYNNDLVKIQTKLDECLREYQTIADTINVFLHDDYYPEIISDDVIISDIPRQTSSMRNNGTYAPVDNYKNYHSRELYNKLYSAAEAYEYCYSNFASINSNYSNTQNELKSVALILSLNYKTLKTEYERCGDKFEYSPILTPDEAKALNYYIYEADWVDDNAVFSDTYSAEDILSTLVDTYNNAKNELANIYCKPTYEFETDLVNISTIPEMQSALDNLYLGNALYIVDKEQLINPVLLNVHIDYSNPANFTMRLSTDYKRKPLELRFSDLFGTISQVSVETPTFTFDT